MPNILDVQSLTKTYDQFTLDCVSFSLPAGYIMGFIGPNGAGKTTTIKAVLGAIQPDSGSVRLFGQPNTDSQADDIGVVLDTPLYVEEWTLNQVGRYLTPFYRRWQEASYLGHLHQFGLDPAKKVSQLSRGMKVKLQIAVALSHQARLLILDEPTSGLDPVARDEIGDLLRQFVADEDHGVFFSTHITADLEKTADYLTFILDGRIAYSGPTDDLREMYVRVAGGRSDLDPDQRHLVIGYREHGTGFDGMVPTADCHRFSPGVLTEEISLDDIIIYMNKGIRHE